MKDLERRLGRFEERTQPGSGVVFIVGEPGETSEEAEARYFAEHPEQRNAKVCYLMVME